MQVVQRITCEFPPSAKYHDKACFDELDDALSDWAHLLQRPVVSTDSAPEPLPGHAVGSEGEAAVGGTEPAPLDIAANTEEADEEIETDLIDSTLPPIDANEASAAGHQLEAAPNKNAPSRLVPPPTIAAVQEMAVAHDNGASSLVGASPNIGADQDTVAVDIENQLETHVVPDAPEEAPVIDHRDQWYYRNYWKGLLWMETFKLTYAEERLARAQQQIDQLTEESTEQRARSLNFHAFAVGLQAEMDEKCRAIRAGNTENSNLRRIIADQEAAAAKAATWHSTAMPQWTAPSGWPPQGGYYMAAQYAAESPPSEQYSPPQEGYYTAAEYAAESLPSEQYSPVLAEDTAQVQLEKELNTTNDTLQVHPYLSPPYGTIYACCAIILA